MHRLAIAALAAALTVPAGAVERVTVAQLEQAVTASHGRPDLEVAQQLSGLELTERLSRTRFAQLLADLPGEKCQQQLVALADSSEFLNLPATEIPSTAAPDAAAQRQMMALVVNYVTRTVHQLPNFFATRETTRFEDRPQVTYGYLPLHFVGKLSKSVVYRDGQEMVEAGATKAKGQQPEAQGLVSWGEFGPILSTVLLDAAQSKLAWSHWEQGANGPEAVFGYSVPGQKSHYWVQTCCTEGVSEDPSGITRERAGYHGEMAVDPATGSIVRLTAVADLTVGERLTKAGIMVEYGAVDVGGKSLICPKRSVALSTMRYAHISNGAHSAFDQDPLQTFVNDVAFEQYHQLRGEARILTSENDEPGGNPGGAGRDGPDISNLQPASVAASTEMPKPAAEAGAVESNAIRPAPAGEAPAPVAAAAHGPVADAAPAPAEPEISVGATGGILPDTPSNTPTAKEGGYVLKVTSRLVDVGVVVVDKKGRPVKDMKPGEFEVYDNGRKQEVKFFNAFSGASAATASSPDGAGSPGSTTSEAERTFSNQADQEGMAGAGITGAGVAGAPATASLTREASATVLLMDETHIAWNDMSHARQEVLKFLDGLVPGERVGLYTITGVGFRVLTEITSDHAAVIARLKKWMPTAQSVTQAQEDETRNRQQFETVHSVADLNSVNGNQADVPDFQSPIDPQLLTMGSNPGRASLIILRGVARHLAAVPGHKNLIWISSDNVFVNWQDQAVGIDKNTTSIDSYALHAQEAMNDAHAAVYPFDVSQLEVGGIGADFGNRNVELDPTVTQGPGGVARDMTAGRTKAAMLQDVRSIQGPIQELAEGTGGRIVRRSGDLAAELGSIVEDGRATYQLSFYPDTPADDKYHAVSVKLVDRKGLTVRGRTGYLYAKEPTTLKERFQQAIWRPVDANEIRVSAAVGKEQFGAKLKINIAAGDLELVQGGGRWVDRLDIFFIQRDDAGLHASVDGQTLGLRLLPATYQNLLTAGVPFEQMVQVKPGTGSLRVVIVDENSSRMGSVTIPGRALGETQ
jgi:VWFA-related protein